MTSSLSAVPVDRRRRSAVGCAVMGVLLLAVAVLPWTVASPASIRLFAVVAGIAALGVLLVGWGLVRSVRADLRAPLACACGHDHDPDELTVRPGACESASGQCAHDCASCVLSRLPAE